MSFLTTQPEELDAAAAKLETIGSAMNAQNAAAAAPTTAGVVPAAADEVSMLQASQFAAYGTLYQQISTEAAAMYDMFVNTLGASAGTYAATEAANSSAAASPFSAISNLVGATPGIPSWLDDLSNIFNIGVGNWASAASDLLGMAGGGLLPAASSAPADAASAVAPAAAVEPAAAAAAGLGEAPIAAVGQASTVGALAVPPSWAAGATPVASTGAATVESVGWTAAAPQATPVTAMPGMPGVASSTRNGAGFGAPRYGAKPIVMPKPETV